MKENTKNTLRKIGMKLLLLIAVLAVLDVLYFFTFYPKDLEEHCSLMELSQKTVPEGDDIVYLGESSNHAYSEADTDRRPISMMLDSLLPAHKVGNLGKAACHASIYYDVLRNIPRQKQDQGCGCHRQHALFFQRMDILQIGNRTTERTVNDEEGSSTIQTHVNGFQGISTLDRRGTG